MTISSVGTVLAIVVLILAVVMAAIGQLPYLLAELFILLALTKLLP